MGYIQERKTQGQLQTRLTRSSSVHTTFCSPHSTHAQTYSVACRSVVGTRTTTKVGGVHTYVDILENIAFSMHFGL